MQAVAERGTTKCIPVHFVDGGTKTLKKNNLKEQKLKVPYFKKESVAQLSIIELIDRVEKQEADEMYECIGDAMQHSANDVRLYNSGKRYMEELGEFAKVLKARILGVDDMEGNRLKNLPGQIARNRLMEVYDEDDGKMKRYLAFDIIRCDRSDGYVCLYALDKHDNKLYKTTFRIVQLYDMLQKKQMKFLCN